MFELVNLVAIFGTAFFMMAVATLWYSEYLFLRPWLTSIKLTEADIDAAAPNQKRNAVVTYMSYVIAIYLIARVIAHVQLYDLSVREVSVLMALGFAALLVGFVLWEQRSFAYYVITVGFSTVFILGSSFFLYYWPW